MSADEVRSRYERIRTEVGDGVTIVAATKYVPVDELAVLAEAGIEVVGEILAELRRRKLNGELDGRESELEAARELIRG